MVRLTDQSVYDWSMEAARDEGRILRGKCDRCGEWLEIDQPTVLFYWGGFYHAWCVPNKEKV